MVGRQLDRYRLVEEIGSGGMAVVYKGIDTALDREVAVKVMHPHLAGKEESRKRFRREARAVAKLHHPSILEIYDFSGDEAKESFIVTEYVRGRTLRAFGDEVGFRLAETAALAIAVLAEALQHAHETGIVHRDLKPENVMVREDGVLKLMDFGIARLVEGDEKMTMTGSLVGSPLHMPPEVIEGRPGDVRSDLFSLGTIFYWLVTKQMAFQAATTTLTLRRILEGQFEDPRALAPACPDELADAITRCLARDPEARFPDVQALRDALKPTLLFAGFERPGEELKRFFADPTAFEAALHARLVPALVARGEAALAAKKTSRALSDFDRVLALDPENARVKEQLARLRSARASRQRRKRLAIGALIAVGAGGLGVGIVSLRPPPIVAPPEPPPIVAPALPAEPPPATPLEPALSTPGEPIAAVTERPPIAKLPKPPPPKPGAPRVEPAVGPKSDPGTPSMATITDWRTVRIRFAPQTAVLWLDGEPQKTSDAPWFEKQLRAGSRVALALVDPSCCERHDEIVEIPRGVDRDDVLDLRYLLKPKNAKVLVASNRADAQVWVENSFKGTVRDVAGKGGFPVAFDPRDRYARRFEVALVDPRTDERRAAEVNVTAGGTATLRVDF